jgi:hypothetical protein
MSTSEKPLGRPWLPRLRDASSIRSMSAEPHLEHLVAVASEQSVERGLAHPERDGGACDDAAFSSRSARLS